MIPEEQTVIIFRVKIECYCCHELKRVENFYPASTQCKACLKVKRADYVKRIGIDVVRERQRQATARYAAKLRRQRGVA